MIKLIIAAIPVVVGFLWWLYRHHTPPETYKRELAELEEKADDLKKKFTDAAIIGNSDLHDKYFRQWVQVSERIDFLRCRVR